MNLISRLFLLFMVISFSSITYAENTIVLGENGQKKEEQAESDTNKDTAKGDKEKKKKKKGSGDEEPECD